MSSWVGKLVSIQPLDYRRKPQLVRIVDTEQATPNMDSRNPSGFWYWARYA